VGAAASNQKIESDERDTDRRLKHVYNHSPNSIQSWQHDTELMHRADDIDAWMYTEFWTGGGQLTPNILAAFFSQHPVMNWRGPA